MNNIINRRKFLKLFSCGCYSLALGSCSTVPITERRQLTIYPESVINRQAASAYNSFKSKNKLINTGKEINNITSIGKKIENATDFALFLLEKAHVATVTGEAFGNGNCIRISYAASEEKIRLAIERISSVLK